MFLVTRELEGRGCSVRGTTSAQEGLSIFRSDPLAFDLVVTDYGMPGMSGGRAAEELLRVRAGVPVVVMSGYVSDEMSAAAARAGARAAVPKPDTIEALCDAIEAFLGEP